MLLFSNLVSSQELKQVTLKTSWLEQFQFAGYYMAKEKGFYNDVGLQVNILPYDIKNKENTAQQVSDGEIDFAVGKETLILDKAQNKKIVLLYAIFQASPLVLISTKESNINTFADFSGKKIMASLNDAQQVSIKAMLNAHNVTLNDLNLLSHSHDIKDLINKKTDIMSAYISKTPYDLEKRGVKYNIFSPPDYGFDMYSDFLYTSEYLIANDLDTTKAFRQASLKGWQYAFAHLGETVNIIFNKYNQQNITKEALLFEAIALKKLAYLNTTKLGVLDENKLKRSFELYKVLGQGQDAVDFKQLIYDDNKQQTFFTEHEQSYLKQKKNITMCIDPNWLPYDGFDDEGKHIGLNTEFLNIFRAQLPIPLETVVTTSWKQSVEYAKQRKCDLLSFASITPERQQYLNYTTPYLILPNVLVSRVEQPFINNFAILNNKKIGMVKGYALQDFVREKYPNIIVVDVDNIKAGLDKVAKGELYGFIEGLDSVGYYLQKEYLGKIKVSGKFDKRKELGIAVRNDHPLLLAIFNKLINNLSQIEIDKITDKSPSVRYIERVNYNYLWWLLFVVLVIVSAFLYKQHLLKNLNKALNVRISEKTKALQALNESLELKIKERTETIERSKVLLQNVAYKDNLTGIFNRHYLFEKSAIFFNTATQYNEPLSMLIIDIDLFKKVNDVHGHIIGDNIIKHCVTCIQKNLRTDDLFARYGGEEFLVLLPKLTINESRKVAEKLRIYLEQHHYQPNVNSNAIPITISIGISEYQVGDSLEKFIDRTDIALYQAKEKGRNQVQVIVPSGDIKLLS